MNDIEASTCPVPGRDEISGVEPRLGKSPLLAFAKMVLLSH